MEKLDKRPVIFDCDPGIDDALALFMAFASEKIEVVGITTASGNVPISHTTDNALRIVELAGKNIEVSRGAGDPLFTVRKTAESVHGKNGIGDIELPEPKGKISDRKPFEMIYGEAEKYKGDLELIATGPLTNVALALMIHPQLSQMIKRIWIMGGAAGSGNRTPAAEFN
ncbi:MAG: nucleoside hydrolase, partial [Proteobacteria bacterium]|nr:nucleoside hydrolase [Pseudomonadota bacterium]